MNDVLRITQLLLGILELAESVGLSAERLIEARNKAKAEGRDLSDEELAAFRSDALAAIERANQA